MEKMEPHTSKNQEFWTLVGANSGLAGSVLTAAELYGRCPQVAQMLDRLPQDAQVLVFIGVPVAGAVIGGAVGFLADRETY